MEEIFKEVEKLSKELQNAKKEIATLEGRREEVLCSLKEQGINSKEELKIEIIKTEKKIDKIKKEVERLFNEIKEKYELV